MRSTSGNIPFIHNYCDRWCERCYFTARCAVNDRVSDLPPEAKDMANKAFWDNISNNLTEAFEGLKRTAAEYSIDLENIHADPDDDKKQMERSRRRALHPLSILSKQYADEGRKWFETTNEIEDKRMEIVRQAELNILPEGQIEEAIDSFKDCIEIIQWYLHFIHVKIQRALSGKLDKNDSIEENFQTDYNGSAKIAKIAMDRSMSAWVLLMQHLPRSEDAILKSLSLLQKIKGILENEFPDMEKFIRPGFDE